MAEAAANVEECLHASGLSFFYFSVEAVDVMAVQAYSEVAVTATMDAAASGSSSFFSSSVAAWALAVALAVAADVAVDANPGMSMQIPA